ncbi:MAG TPA: hemerythrin domain-containing protein [Steroidobacteraceae bacterium]|jgi:hemerythrin-like domain-containing protein
MASRRSKTGNRSAAGKRGGGKSRRGKPPTRSLSASRRTAGTGRAKRGRRSGSSAPYAVKLLRQDHREVAAALEEFESAGHEEKQSIAQRICRMLSVHTQIEEEILYPTARGVFRADDAHLVAEADVEHASVKALIQQIEQARNVDEEYEAKVHVMGEFVKHHVKEEETELFPKLERTSLDLDSLGERLEMRKAQLMGEEADGRDMQEEEEDSRMSSGRSRGSRGRQSPVHARRR